MFSSTRHLVLDHIELFLFAACSVAIRLVHVNANLFLSRKIDQFSNAVTSVLRYHCNLRDGIHAVLRVSSVVIILNCLQSVKL